MNESRPEWRGQSLPLPYWTIAWTRDALEPARFLGVLRDLPPAEDQHAGDWCELIHDDLNERWTLLVVDPAVAVQVGSRGRAARSRAHSGPSECVPVRRAEDAYEGAAP